MNPDDLARRMLERGFLSPETLLPDPAAPPASTASPQDRYDLLALLGEGASGQVYRARDLATGRLVALKRVHLGVEGPDDRARFQRELDALVRLRHEGIPVIYDAGYSNDDGYYAMELIDGVPLDRYVRATGLPLRARAELLEKAARIVHFAHTHGFVHRDLKPANLLVTANGQPYVVDFGLAKPLAQAANVTATGTALGTPLYMAPEQADGRKSDIGPRSDVFSLGAILYHLLAGRPPFAGDSLIEILSAVLLRDPTPLHELDPSVPPALEAVVARALQKEPDRRYPSALAFADDLRVAAQRGAPGNAGRSPAVVPGARPVLVHALLAVGLGLAVGVILWLRSPGHSQSQPPDDAVPARAPEGAANVAATPPAMPDRPAAGPTGSPAPIGGGTTDPLAREEQALDRWEANPPQVDSRLDFTAVDETITRLRDLVSDPRGASAHRAGYLLGRALVCRGQPRAALPYLDRAIQGSGPSTPATYFLLRALARWERLLPERLPRTGAAFKGPRPQPDRLTQLLGPVRDDCERAAAVAGAPEAPVAAWLRELSAPAAPAALAGLRDRAGRMARQHPEWAGTLWRTLGDHQLADDPGAAHEAYAAALAARGRDPRALAGCALAMLALPAAAGGAAGAGPAGPDERALSVARAAWELDRNHPCAVLALYRTHCAVLDGFSEPGSRVAGQMMNALAELHLALGAGSDRKSDDPVCRTVLAQLCVDLAAAQTTNGKDGLGLAREATAACETTSAEDPGHLDALWALARAQLILAGAEAGRIDLQPAITRLRELVKLSPDFARAHLSLGDALALVGDADAASEWQQAATLDPTLADEVKTHRAKSRR